MLTQDKVAKVFREFYASEIEPRFRKSDKVFECEMVTQKCREATIAAWKAGKTADEIIAAIRAAVPLFFERKRPKRPTVAAFKFHNRILTDMWFTHDGRVIPIRNWYTHAHVALTELHGDKAFEAYLAQRTEEKDARAKENNRPELVAFRYVIMQLGWIRTAAISYGESLVVQAAAKRVAPRAASTFLRWFVKQEANEYIVDFTDEGHVDIPMDTAGHIYDASQKSFVTSLMRNNVANPSVRAFNEIAGSREGSWILPDGTQRYCVGGVEHAYYASKEFGNTPEYKKWIDANMSALEKRTYDAMFATFYAVVAKGWIRSTSDGHLFFVKDGLTTKAINAASDYIKNSERDKVILEIINPKTFNPINRQPILTLNEALRTLRQNKKKRVEIASVNDYILYHSTYPERALTALRQNEFKFRPIVGTRSDQNVPNSYFMSLTRSKLNSFAVANAAHYYVMFNLNRRTIAKRFKIYPVSYWQDRGNIGKMQFNDEAEERITSNTPDGLKIPANAKELIDSVHILAEQKSIDEKTYPKTAEKLLKLVRLCKTKRIPVFIYADKKSFLVQNRLRAKPLSYLLDAYQSLRPEIRDAYVYRGSDRRKSYDGVRIHGLIQLFKVDKYSQLDKAAKKVWYDWVRRADPAYGHLTADVVASLEAAIHNANSEPNSQIRKAIDSLLVEMKKHGFKTLKEMLNGLNVKWGKILDAKDKAERESREASKKLFDLDGYYGAWITDSGDYIGIVSKKGYVNTVAQQFPNDAEIQKFADAKDHDGLSAFLMRKRGWIRLTLPRGHDEASGNEDVDTHSPDYHRRATIDMANNRASHKALETLERLFRSGGGGFKTTEINIDDKRFEFTWRNSDERKKLMRAQYNRKGIPEFKKNEETAQAEGQMPYGYWIDPKGKIEAVDFEKHWYLASAVIRSRLNAPMLYKEYPTEALQTAYGYARTINRYFETDRNSLSISIPKGGLTSTQASALASIFKDNGFDKAVVEIISEQPDAKGFEHDYAHANSLYELNVVLRKNVAKKQVTAGDDDSEHASWWIERWVSGSMDDPDWDASWNRFTPAEAFAVVQKAVGGKAVAGKTLWRYLLMPRAAANALSKSKQLTFKKFPFQSFTQSRKSAIEVGRDIHGYIKPGHVEVVVSCIPPRDQIIFSSQDLAKDKGAFGQSYRRLADWHHQKEVLVKASPALKLQSVELVKHDETANVSHSWIDDEDGRFWLLHDGAVVWVGPPTQYDHEMRARQLVLSDYKKEYAAWRRTHKNQEYSYTVFAMSELGWIRMAADNAYDISAKRVAKPAAMKLIRALSQRRDDPANPVIYYVITLNQGQKWVADEHVSLSKCTRREAMEKIAHNIKGAVITAALDDITLRYVEGFHDFENEQIVRPLYFDKNKALFNTYDGFYRDKIEPFAKKYKLNKANRFRVLKFTRVAFMLGHKEGEIPGALKAAEKVFEEIRARYRDRKATPKGQLELFASDASIWDTNNNCFIDADGKIHWIDEDHMDFAADWIAKHPADKKEFEDQHYSSAVDYLLHRGWVRVRNTHRNAIEISKDRLSLKAYRTLVRQLRDTQEDTYLDVTYHEKNILRNVGGKFEPHEKSRLFSVLQDNVVKHDAKAATLMPEEKYWIDPKGKKHILTASESHRSYISREGLTLESAIKEGWIRARYDASGDASVSFMFLKGALSSKAVNACIRLIAECDADLEYIVFDVVQKMPLSYDALKTARLTREKKHLAIELLQKNRAEPPKGFETTASMTGAWWIDENGKTIDVIRIMHFDYAVKRFADDPLFETWFKKEYHYRDMKMALGPTISDGAMRYVYHKLGWIRVTQTDNEMSFSAHKGFAAKRAVVGAIRMLVHYTPKDETAQRYLLDNLNSRSADFIQTTNKAELIEGLRSFARVNEAIASSSARTAMDMWITHEGRTLPVGEEKSHSSVAYDVVKNDADFHAFFKTFTGKDFSESDPKRKLIARFYATNALGWIRCSALDQDVHAFNVDFKKDGIARRAANVLLRIINEDFPDGYHIDVLNIAHIDDGGDGRMTSKFFKSFEGLKAAALVRENIKKNVAVAATKDEKAWIKADGKWHVFSADGEHEDWVYSIEQALDEGWVRAGTSKSDVYLNFSEKKPTNAAIESTIKYCKDKHMNPNSPILVNAYNDVSKFWEIPIDRISSLRGIMKGTNTKRYSVATAASVVVAAAQPAFWIAEKLRSPYMVVLTVRTRGRLFRTPIGWNKRTFIAGEFRRFLVYKYVGVITPRQLDLEIQNVMATIARQNGTRVDIKKARRAINRTSLGFLGMGAAIRVTAGAVNWDTGKPIVRKFYDTRTLGAFPLTKKQCNSWGIVQGTPIETAPVELKGVDTFDKAILPKEFPVTYRKFSNAFARKIASNYSKIAKHYESEPLARADMSRAIDLIVSKGGEAMCLDYLRDRFEDDSTFKRKVLHKDWRAIYLAMLLHTRSRLAELQPMKIALR